MTIIRHDAHVASLGGVHSGKARRERIRERDLRFAAERQTLSIRAVVKKLIAEQISGLIPADWLVTISTVANAPSRLLRGSVVRRCVGRACGAIGGMCHGRNWIPWRDWKAMAAAASVAYRIRWRPGDRGHGQYDAAPALSHEPSLSHDLAPVLSWNSEVAQNRKSQETVRVTTGGGHGEYEAALSAGGLQARV